MNDTNNNINEENKLKVIYFNGEKLEIKEKMLNNLEILVNGSLFKEKTNEIFNNYIIKNNLKRLFKHEENNINSALLNEKTKFFSPVETFKMQENKGVYTKNYINMLELIHIKSVEDMIFIIKETENNIINKINVYEKCLETAEVNNDRNISINNTEENSNKDTENNILISCSSDFLIYKKEPKETIEYYQCNSGYTTISSSEASEDEYEEDNDYNNHNNSNSRFIDSNHYTSKINYDTINNKLSNIIKGNYLKNKTSSGNINNNNINNYLIKNNLNNNIEGDKSMNNLNNKSNNNNLNSDSKINKIDSKANSKIIKNQVTVNPRTEEEIEFYRKQEIQRYKFPHLPWIFYSLDGLSKFIVGPVLKRPPPSGISKPRDHPMLKKERPGYITILCLARDAASKLENFVGTRADICELIKDSCYINERITDNQINTIVSGALDRLHYEKDPSVKYDVQKKLWIYLHGNWNLDYHGKLVYNYNR